MEELNKKIKSILDKLPKGHNILPESTPSVFPFNPIENILSKLLAGNHISLKDYASIRNSYLERNKYLYLFEISAPRGFGETWAQNHLIEIEPSLVKASSKEDKDFDGEYDLILPIEKKIIKIEVKASRAVDANLRCSLPQKALNFSSKRPFDMNFQQIKPDCCDVFIWIGVWRDSIHYWVLNTKDVTSNSYYNGSQHRGNSGEGQLHLKDSNIHEFEVYKTPASGIKKAILERFKA